MEPTAEGELKPNEIIQLNRDFLLFDPNRPSSKWIPYEDVGDYFSKFTLRVAGLPDILFATSTDTTLGTKFHRLVPFTDLAEEGYIIDNRDFNLEERKMKAAELRKLGGRFDESKTPSTLDVHLDWPLPPKHKSNPDLFEDIEVQIANGSSLTEERIKIEYQPIIERLRLLLNCNGAQFIGQSAIGKNGPTLSFDRFSPSDCPPLATEPFEDIIKQDEAAMATTFFIGYPADKSLLEKVKGRFVLLPEKKPEKEINPI